jgi:hypothetical protein
MQLAKLYGTTLCGGAVAGFPELREIARLLIPHGRAAV